MASNTRLALAPNTAIQALGCDFVYISVPAITGGTISVRGSIDGTGPWPLLVTQMSDMTTNAAISIPGLYRVVGAGSISYTLSGGSATVNIALKR
jgi:hypothetical protein